MIYRPARRQKQQEAMERRNASGEESNAQTHRCTASGMPPATSRRRKACSVTAPEARFAAVARQRTAQVWSFGMMPSRPATRIVPRQMLTFVSTPVARRSRAEGQAEGRCCHATSCLEDSTASLHARPVRRERTKRQPVPPSAVMSPAHRINAQVAQAATRHRLKKRSMKANRDG